MEKLVQASEIRTLPRIARSFPVYLVSGELQQILELEHITQQELAELLGVSTRRVFNWEKKPELIPRPIVKAIGLRYPKSFLKVIPKARFINQRYSLMFANVHRFRSLTQIRLAKLIGISRREFALYERGVTDIPDNIRDHILFLNDQVEEIRNKRKGIYNEND